MNQKTKNLFLILFYLVKHPKRFYNALSARGKKWALRSLIVLLIVLIGVPATLWYQSKTAQAAWWNDSWQYRQKIQLTNSTGADLTDFQVSTVVDTAALITAGKMITTTCADMRFTDSKGQPLDYWIEENNPGCNSATTKVWLKAPKVYSGTNATSIYMYYGNPSATATQSGDKTFEFFDDFNGSSINTAKWTINDSTGWSVSGGALNGTNTTGRISTIKTFSAPFKAETRYQETSGASNGVENLGTYVSSSDAFGGFLMHYRSAFTTEGFTRNDSSYIAFNASGDYLGYHLQKIWADSSNNAYAGYYKGSASAQANYTNTISNEPIVLGKRYDNNFSGQSYDANWDWLMVRKYASADPTTSASAEEIGPGPIAYWKFDEGQGSTAYNSTSQTGINGTITGATWKPESDCVAGKCLDYDGTDDVTTVTQSASINLTGKTGYTLSTWIRADGAGENNTGEIIDKGANTYLRVDNPSGSNLDIEGQIDLGTTPANLNISAGVQINKWYHIEMVYADDGDDEIDIYINGVLKGTSINGDGSLPTETNNLLIGGDSSHNFNGSIDETKIYPYARSAAQVQQDFNAGQAGNSSPEGANVTVGESPKWMTDGLVGHWKMDESSGTTVADASGNGNTGTLTNAQETGTSDASGNSVTTMVDTDGSLSTTNDAYNNMILRFTSACGSIASGTERTITDYTGTPHTFTVATLAQAPDSCAYEVRHQTGGKFGNGVGFDGTNDHINFTVNRGPVSGTGPFTLSTWIKTSTTNSGIIFQQRDSGDFIDEYMFSLSNGKINYFDYGQWGGGGGRYGLNFSSLASVNDDNWHHVVFVRNGINGYIYIDGKLDNSAVGERIINISSALDFAIGFDLRDNVSFLKGNLDDARIYNRALSPDEVKQMSEYGPGPVGWWKMDENVSGNNQTIVDSSGNGNNGTTDDGANNTGMDCTKQGKYGGGCSFDGADDRINMGDPASGILDIGRSDFSYSMWFKRPQTGSGYFLGKEGNPNGFNFYINGPNTGIFNLNANGTSYSNSVSMSYAINNEWNHLEIIGNRSGNLTVYMNGKNQLSFSIAGAIGVDINNANNFLIGNNGQNTRVMNGALDDVRVYNYARSPKQITEDMNAGHPAPGSPVGSPVAYYKMDEGYGTSSQDASQNNQDLTLVNTPAWTTGGKFGRALDYEKDSTEYAWTADSVGLSITSDLTVSGWIKPESVTAATLFDIAGKWDGANASYLLAQYGTELRMYIDAAGNYKTTSGLGLVAGTWYYVSATYSASAQTVTLYVNGVDKGGSVTGTIPASIGDDAGRFHIGAQDSTGGAASYFDGLIDEVKIYNSALTPEQIKLDMNQGKELQLGGQSSVTGATGQAAEYCVPGDATSCAGPVGEWKFDEKTGATANDTSGNGIAGTLGGTVSPTWTRGKVGSALSFSNGYVSSSSAPTPTTVGTVEAWVKVNSWGSSYDTVFFKGTGSNFAAMDYTLLRSNADPTFVGSISNGTSYYSIAGPHSSTINLGQWYHLVFTWDSSSGGKFYTNGVLTGTYNSNIVAANSTQNMRIGKGNGNGYPFNGVIDDVRVFNYARTPAQIAWDYNRGKPVGWWKMDEGEGVSAYDSSGNANTGTLTTMDPPNDWVAGKFGKALDFDGSSDHVLTGNSGGNIQNYVSVGAWVKTSGSSGTVVNKDAGGGNANRAYKIQLSSGKVNIIVFKSSVVYDSVTSNSYINDNQWHHILGTWDGNTINVYIDGKLDGFKNYSGVINSNQATPLYFAKHPYAGFEDYFTGQIDDVRIYNYALTAEQVKQVMNEGSVVRFGD